MSSGLLYGAALRTELVVVCLVVVTLGRANCCGTEVLMRQARDAETSVVIMKTCAMSYC
jgi:hypothetical protein